MIDFKLIRKEVTELLVDIIKFDTTNPPGNERALAEFFAEKFNAEGIENKILDSSKPERATFWAKIPGEEDVNKLLLLSHLDVVPADKSLWSTDPFSGEIKDGYIYGRGALDIKILGAMHAVIMFLIKRNNIKLKYNLIMLSVADEEEGGSDGAKFVLENFPELTEAEFVLGEGGYGTLGILPENKPLFSLSTGEKGVTWVKATVEGQSGHGSMPLKESAPNNLINFLHKVANHRFPMKFTDSMKVFLQGIGDEKGGINKFLMNNVSTLSSFNFVRGKLEENSKLSAALQNTVSVTKINAGYKDNVIPEKAEATLDCRLVPGETVDGFLNELKLMAKPFGVKIEPINVFNPNESTLDTQLYKIMDDVFKEEEIVMLPYIAPGFTDTRFFRIRGSVGYGIVPIVVELEELEGIHGVDERVSVDNMEFGTRILFEIVKRFMEKI